MPAKREASSKLGHEQYVSSLYSRKRNSRTVNLHAHRPSPMLYHALGLARRSAEPCCCRCASVPMGLLKSCGALIFTVRTYWRGRQRGQRSTQRIASLQVVSGSRQLTHYITTLPFLLIYIYIVYTLMSIEVTVQRCEPQLWCSGIGMKSAGWCYSLRTQQQPTVEALALRSGLL